MDPLAKAILPQSMGNFRDLYDVVINDGSKKMKCVLGAMRMVELAQKGKLQPASVLRITRCKYLDPDIVLILNGSIIQQNRHIIMDDSAFVVPRMQIRLPFVGGRKYYMPLYSEDCFPAYEKDQITDVPYVFQWKTQKRYLTSFHDLVAVNPLSERRHVHTLSATVELFKHGYTNTHGLDLPPILPYQHTTSAKQNIVLSQ